MSGEVRKRKDKKKRKDDASDASFSSSNEDVNIHVYKEGGTGGNICAKIVFVLLFSALIVLVGLIIRENQGLNELENVEESRFSQIFEGWVEKSKTSDEHDDDHSPEDIRSHEDENEDDDDDHHYESDEQSLENSEEEQEDESQEYEEPEEYVAVSEEVEEESVEESTEKSEENLDDDDESDMKADESDEKPESDDDDDTIGDNDNDDVEEKSDEGDVESEEINREADASKEKVDDIEPEEAEISEVKPEKEEETTKEETQPKESPGLTTKIGVGLAILTVAYNVFLRKKPSDVDKEPIGGNQPTPNVSRRNTIVPPPTLQEIEADLPDLELEEEAYSDEEEYSDNDSHSEHRSAREEYEDLRETYSVSLTPDGEFDAKPNYFEHKIAPNEDDDEIVEEEEELLDEEEEEEIESEDDYDEDEDEKLLKRLEAKYGKLGRDINVGEESQSEGEDYEHSNITNEEDYKIKNELDNAQEQLKKNAAFANKLFEALVKRYPFSPRSLYGKAQALDILAEQNQRNDLLQIALEYYMKAFELNDVPEYLYKIIGERYIDRSRFMGQYNKALKVHWKLIQTFPDDPAYLNKLAVTYLTVNYIEEARSVLKKVLTRWPNDGFALVHYGFILKTTDNLLQESVDYMSKGLKTKAEGVVDGRFYFHLGDALSRLNKPEEAMEVYEEGVKENVFISKYQRSLYNVPRLTGKPWWNAKDLPIYQKLFKALKDNWLDIRREGLAALSSQGYFQDEAENLKDTGTWKQFELFARGRKSKKNCEKSPVTCSIIQSFPDASSCKRGQTKFSVMHPKTHVWPHCGPTNCRLRLHLGLKVPPNTFIRVAEETRSWKEGDIIIFDDSFEHEVWHNGSDFRLVLIVDIWHPELTKSEKLNLSYI